MMLTNIVHLFEETYGFDRDIQSVQTETPIIYIREHTLRTNRKAIHTYAIRHMAQMDTAPIQFKNISDR